MKETAEEKMRQSGPDSLVGLVAANENPYGFFSFADASPAAGGGIGALQWFKSREELNDFLADYAVLIWQEFDSKEAYNSLRDSIRKALGDPSEASPDLDALHSILRGLFCIEWIGTFAELATSDAEFALKVRSFYSDAKEGGSNHHTPLSSQDFLDFAKAIEDYGM